MAFEDFTACNRSVCLGMTCVRYCLCVELFISSTFFVSLLLYGRY